LWPPFLPAVCGWRFVVMFLRICCFGVGMLVAWWYDVVWCAGMEWYGRPVVAELGVSLAFGSGTATLVGVVGGQCCLA
ncbi:hypothetical protein A2U01_0096267, partial [Trifolium medium]|nr:hypothetical protein [Trifolium medium]